MGVGRLLLDDSTLVTLGHGVHVLARGDDAVQFGVDPTRSGVIETQVARALIGVLSDADWPLEIGELRDQLVSGCGVDSTEARTLIDDLCAYRILISPDPVAVALLGTTPLAREVRRLLGGSGVTVRIPLINEDTTAFLDRQAQSPLVVVDRAHDYWKLGRSCKDHPNWVVPVLSLDSRVIVGPVTRNGSGPCPTCALMRLHDRDTHFSQAVEDASKRPRTMDAVVAAAGAAAVTLVVRRLAGVPDPPGVIAAAPEPGWAAVIDPLGPQLITAFDVETHPLCPVCATED